MSQCHEVCGWCLGVMRCVVGVSVLYIALAWRQYIGI